MDRFTENRLKDDAIQHAGDRASFRKPAHPVSRSPSRSIQSTHGELGEQLKPSLLESRGKTRHLNREGRTGCRT
jgi:hypothetical protein